MVFKLSRDDISPALRKMAAAAKRPAPVLRSMGTTFKSITEGTFNSVGASYRPVAWKAKQDGTPSILQRSTTMAKAFHLEVTNTYARVSNPMVYARIHQLGGVIKPKNKPFLSFMGSDGKRYNVKKVTIPARPFFPVLNGKLTPAAEEKIQAAGERAMRRQAGQ